MKYIFVIASLVLALAGVGTYLSYPDVSSKVPVIYWVSDANPARVQQIDLFHQWLVKQGRTTPDGQPMAELRLDAANRDVSKMIIQGVSGVGGDVMDLNSGRGMVYFHAMGLLSDMTDAGLELGFDPSQTYAAIKPEITLDGRQYTFPCNVATNLAWVNLDTLAQYGQPAPPRRWTFEEFERLGKAFVQAANPPGERQTRFYANKMDLMLMHRSLGLSVFNETMTRCTLDDPRFVQCLKLLYKWTYEDRIIPSEADEDAFDTQSGYGGAAMQLFNKGNYALLFMGRYALIQLRKFGQLELGVVEPPHGGFPNSVASTRAAGVYIGGPHQEMAELFLAYLASEDYNMQIVRDADAMPPNPKYTQTQAFLRPPDHPNEWGLHEVFTQAIQDIAVGSVNSPFILTTKASRLITESKDQFMNHLMSASQAAEEMARRINGEIDRALSENPALQPAYDQLVARQEQIDQLRAQGKPVPLEWITNPFYRRYYQKKGWALP